MAQAVTGGDGIAVLELAPELWGSGCWPGWRARRRDGVVLSRAELDGEVAAVLTVNRAGKVNARRFALLADHLVATRRVRADDLANDLAAPSPDSIVRLMPAGRASAPAGEPRARSSERAERRRDGRPAPGGSGRTAQRQGETGADPRAAEEVLDLPGPVIEIDLYIKPGPGLGHLPLGVPDDQSYRDYLRSVFVLFAQQQKLGVGADPAKYFRDSSSASCSDASSRTSVPPTAPKCRSIGCWCRWSPRS